MAASAWVLAVFSCLAMLVGLSKADCGDASSKGRTCTIAQTGYKKSYDALLRDKVMYLIHVFRYEKERVKLRFHEERFIEICRKVDITRDTADIIKFWPIYEKFGRNMIRNGRYNEISADILIIHTLVRLENH
ncbi:hypothetical protein [Metabacillus sp. 84]|uniref:hypothetical protein n=1 Tax=Metabacillus sp. 84 TaxID=3404705 RepID=UPI003CE783D1